MAKSVYKILNIFIIKACGFSMLLFFGEEGGGAFIQRFWFQSHFELGLQPYHRLCYNVLE